MSKQSKKRIRKSEEPLKEIKTLTKIIRGVMIYWIVFVCIAWITYWIKGDVPEVLIQYGLGGGAIELVAGAIIEVVKALVDVLRAWLERKYHIHEHAGDNDNTDVSGDSSAFVGSEFSPDTGSQGPVG